MSSQENQDQAELPLLNWDPNAPRGGKAVMGRILKEGASVPLFFAQTLINSLRDVGYNHTTSALCEHVDNAIQAGATEIRVYFSQAGKRGAYEIDVAVYDNGTGMPPAVLKVATSFGGSTTYGNRMGIGRYGMGMKTAALSISPVLEIYSWQEAGAIYNMTLDVEAIGRERTNLVALPDPSLVKELPSEVAHMLTNPMSYPSDPNEQRLLASSRSLLQERLGKSGTIVFMPNCDRLTYAKAKTLADHATIEMARVYRRAIGKGLKLFVNNRQLEAIDPTYSMTNARHTRVLELKEKVSRLITVKHVDIRIAENAPDTAPVIARVFKLPMEEWSELPRKTQKNDLRVFDGNTVSILRNDREVSAGDMPWLAPGHITAWYRVQIDFPGSLDEAFGVSANKQGVRLKQYVQDALKEALRDDIAAVHGELVRYQRQRAALREAAKASPSELRASETDALQQHPVPGQMTPEEEAALDASLRGLAVTLKREGETEEQAFVRIKSSKYIIDFKHDDYWPFYDVRNRFGRVILTLNTGHPFFTELYEPLRRIWLTQGSTDSVEGANAKVDSNKGEPQSGPLFALELLLLSLARTQSRLSSAGEDERALLDQLRREWSETYRIQMKQG